MSESPLFELRPGTAADLAALDKLFSYYVHHGHISFDTRERSPAEQEAWFAAYAPTGPYRLLVATNAAGEVAGCAYSSRYRPHPAFDRTVETSIYLAPDQGGMGLGTALYTRLFQALADQPLHRAVAGIALPNEASVRLHRRLGFEIVGVFDEYAWKQGQPISSIWMQKRLDAAL